MSHEDVRNALKRADLRAHMKAAISVTSPMCELNEAINEAAALFEKTIIFHLKEFIENYEEEK